MGRPSPRLFLAQFPLVPLYWCVGKPDGLFISVNQNRISHRWRECDYTEAGAYYVTICSHGERCIFGSLNCGKVSLSSVGMIVRDEWFQLPLRRPRVRLDCFEVMPNHLHGIIIIGERTSGSIAGDPRVAPTNLGEWRPAIRPKGPAQDSLGAIVGQYKAGVTMRVRREIQRPGYRVWQRDYYDHVIRDDEDWDRIRAYIIENPQQWRSAR